MPAIMHVIPFSHFNEKGMWILDYKGIPYEPKPIENPANRGYIKDMTGGSTTLPVFQDGATVIGDTSVLALAMDERAPEPRLVPADEPERTEVLLWDDWADNSLGVHIRRWLFSHFYTENPEGAIRLFQSTGLSPFKAKMAWKFIGPRIIKSLGATEESGAASASQVTQALRILKGRLADRAFLVGDTFTLADLAVCALLTPGTIAGAWKDDPEFAAVFEWRRAICEQHGRRTLPTDPIPSQEERTRRREVALAPVGA